MQESLVSSWGPSRTGAVGLEPAVPRTAPPQPTEGQSVAVLQSGGQMSSLGRGWGALPHSLAGGGQGSRETSSGLAK